MIKILFFFSCDIEFVFVFDFQVKTVPSSKRIGSDGYPGRGLLSCQAHLSICGTLNYFSTSLVNRISDYVFL